MLPLDMRKRRTSVDKLHPRRVDVNAQQAKLVTQSTLDRFNSTLC